jgi:hypothetical protein
MGVRYSRRLADLRRHTYQRLGEAKSRILPPRRDVGGRKTGSAFALSDVQFLAEFDLPQASEQLGCGNVAATKQLLLQHYQQREPATWPTFPRRFTDAEDLSDEDLRRRADDVCEHRFGDERLWLGDKVDWSYNPTSDPRARWTRDLHRHRWLAPLAVAYQRTRKEEYARAFVDLILDWIAANPMPPRKQESSVAWTLMGVGMRGSIWPAAFAIFYPSPEFTDGAKFTVLRSIYDHAQFLSRFKTHLNHVLRESNGLASLAIYFPEFKKAAHWRLTAFTRLEQELLEHVNPDGSSVEMSTGYQWLVAEEFEATSELLAHSGVRLPGLQLDEWLVRLYAALAFILRPDGKWPNMDDGFMDDDAVQRRKLAAAGGRFNRADFKYIASQGAAGQRPQQTSAALPEAGLYVMRSDWAQDALYLLLDAGPFAGPHGHEDKLGIEVCAYGQPFIVDPGCYTYNAGDPYRAYFASSRSHSTATVAGMSQVRRWHADYLYPVAGTREPARWVSCASFDYAEGLYRDGYGEFRFRRQEGDTICDQITHVRRVLFVKARYWLVVDEFTSAREHEYEILYHLAPDVKADVYSPGRSYLYLDDSPVTLQLHFTSVEQIETNVVCGCADPLQGWYANGWHEHKVATNTILCRVKARSTAVISTLLYPTQRRQPAVDFQAVEVAGGSGRAYRVDSHYGTDFLMVSADQKSKSFGPCTSEARIAGFRSVADEPPVELFSWG